jgi:hypothetical protein
MSYLTRVGICVLMFIVVLVCALPAAAQGIGLVSDALMPQQTDVWCWAASGEMAMDYFGVNIQQCAEATYQFGQKAGVNCCNNPTPGACVSGGQVEISHYGFTYQQLGGSSALSPSQIENQISSRHEPWIFNPYCANQSQCGQWGHVLTGVGYWAPFQNIIPGLTDLFFLFVNDPWPPNVGSFYLEFYPAYASGCWWGNGSCNGYAEGWDIYDIVPPKKNPPRYKALEPVSKIAEADARALLQGDQDPQKAAQLAWRIVNSAMTDDVATRLGFKSAAEARGLTVSRPIEQYDVALPRLREFKAQASAEPLLQHAPSLIVPVEAGGHIRSTIRLRQEGNQWRLLAVGSPEFSAALEKGRAAGGQFVVFVEGLEVAYAGKRVNGKLNLVPLHTVARLNVKEGEELPAERALGGLVQHAVEFHGNGATTSIEKLKPQPLAR